MLTRFVKNGIVNGYNARALMIKQEREGSRSTVFEMCMHLRVVRRISNILGQVNGILDGRRTVE